MKQSGFTLIELMVVIAIVAIVATIGVPSVSNMIARNRITASTNELIGAMNLARLEAVKQGTAIRVSSISGSVNWASGYRVWTDEDSDQTYDSGEEIRVFDGSGTLEITGPSDPIIFLASGFTSQNSGTTSLLTICSDEEHISDRLLTINTAGRVTIAEGTCP